MSDNGQNNNNVDINPDRSHQLNNTQIDFSNLNHLK
jgi:hypothetical protein